MRLSTLSSLLLSTVWFYSAATTAQGNNGFPDLATLTDSSSSKASKTAGASKTENTGDSGAITSPGSLSSSSYDGIVNAPTVTNGGDNIGVPTYPPPSVPPTASAPFMQHSALPQGTVFISVGAVIGFAFAVVIAWRVLVVWSVHRSMKRASRGYALMDSSGKSRVASESKSILMAPFLPSKERGSSLSLDPLTAAGRSQSKTPLAAAAERQSLFFSPTAGSGTPTPAGDRGSAIANRTSTYLPAGYYQTGSSTAGGARPVSTQDLSGGGAANNRPASGYRSSSTQNLLVETRPNSVYRRSSDLSGNFTPSNELPPTLPFGRNDSPRVSSGSLAAPGDMRAPSAFLDDLFDYPAEPQPGSRP